MFKKIGLKTLITSDLAEIESAEKIILPGVGSFDAAINKINELGIKPILEFKSKEEKIPILGICLGMQLLTECSEEGNLPGLGFIKSKTTKFPMNIGLKIPHMGWNDVQITKQSPLTRDLPPEPRFYFVHSYCVHVEDNHDSLLKTHYGIEFDSAIQHENIFGVQFHPEKSHKFGMKLLKNFGDL
jgi:glutamine amidotransferase